MVPTREIYWNIHGHWIMYLLFVIVLGVFCYGCYKHIRLWRIGQPEKRWDQLGTRLLSVLTYGFGHKRIVREGYPGLMHLGIFWGFVIAVIGTITVAIHTDAGLPVFQGNFYLGLSLLLDLGGLAAIMGIVMAMVRRYVLKPDRLDNKADDAFSLVLILLILITGFLLEGLRIAGTGDLWAAWTPVGQAASLLFAGLPQETIIKNFQVFWWGHLILAFLFIAYLPYGKLFHILTGPINQFFRNLGPKSNVPLIDFEDENLESFGAEKIQEFTWKQLMDTDVCISCGRCQDNCPAYLTEKPLSPKALGQALKFHLHAAGGEIIAADKTEEAGAGAQEAAAAMEGGTSLIGDVVEPDTIWSCTTCRSCEEQCPVFVEHVNRIIEMRRYLTLMESEFPPELQVIFRNMENNSNPWGVGWANRADWAKELEVTKLAESSEVEYLYWVGCAGSFDDRNKKVATAVIKLLQKAGIAFAILGTEEQCCGDSARGLGNENLYQTMAMANIETMNNYGVKKIIASCPHCYNTLKNEYPQLGGNFQVVHHTELLKQLIKEGKLQPEGQGMKVVYHDSCYLGRYNNIYDEPREILTAVPNVTLVEPERNRERSFCCGAGGGRMWMEEHLGRRINEERAEEAIRTGSDVIATACPFCLTMLDDGAKAKGNEEIQVLDLAEILLKVIK
ncbi:(Fe-S)-binding protein [Sporomusa sphaeroides]|uniref:(Fe-S)-binding protein n=1 Tax=Sporomusa sphaeroides TaxID=47679 RepID=UPI002C65E0B1|nr:(Fe-S)-binding protein [Sporomusa sphaeroides]HML33964.1 (Fe-S)-binding protein [Sporomusa sphaeroides]